MTETSYDNSKGEEFGDFLSVNYEAKNILTSESFILDSCSNASYKYLISKSIYSYFSIVCLVKCFSSGSKYSRSLSFLQNSSVSFIRSKLSRLGVGVNFKPLCKIFFSSAEMSLFDKLMILTLLMERLSSCSFIIDETGMFSDVSCGSDLSTKNDFLDCCAFGFLHH